MAPDLKDYYFQSVVNVKKIKRYRHGQKRLRLIAKGYKDIRTTGMDPSFDCRDVMKSKV
jgi:hypothetical protein